MTLEEAKSISGKLGFQYFSDIRGVRDISDLFVKKGKDAKTGIYILFRNNGYVYIGQSTNVAIRVAKHRENGAVIEFIAFRQCPRSELAQREYNCIKDAAALELPLINQAYVRRSMSKRDEHFDAVIPPADQDRFIDNLLHKERPLLRWPSLFKHSEPSNVLEWDLFSLLPKNGRLIDAVRAYVRSTIPAPKDTVEFAWQAVLMNLGEAEGAMRTVIRIRCGSTTTLTLHYYRRAPHQYFISFNVDSELMRQAEQEQKSNEYMPWTSYDFPSTAKPLDIERLVDESMNVQHQEDVVASPVQRANELLRPIAMVDVDHLGTITVPIEAFEDTISDPIVAAAAAMANVACMRAGLVKSDDHNRLLSFRLVDM